MNEKMKNVSFIRCLIPVISLAIIIIVGAIIIPWTTSSMEEITLADGTKQMISNQGASVPLEFIFMLAITISVINLFTLGYKWDDIQNSIVKKVAQLVPAAMILMSIGVVVGSWVFSGTIPMLISYGIDLINPKYIYLVAFVVPSIFSLLTGTSWGSAGTIGVVIMGISIAIGADPAITAGAIVGGSYFGDKLSPLSDTTNVAALAADVPLMDHVRSMLNTTGPAYILAAITYAIIGFAKGGNNASVQLADAKALQVELAKMFNFSSPLDIILLVLPILVVVYGAIKKKPTVPVLISASLMAAFVGVVVQNHSIMGAFESLISGFNISSLYGENFEASAAASRLLERGGLYSMSSAIFIAIIVFIYVGTLDVINAIPRLVKGAFGWAKTRRAVIFSSQISTAITNALSSNQFATSFIIAEAFKPKYNEQRIPRKVLSRSIEDFGTMIEGMLPWTTTGIYMYGALGVSAAVYWKFQFISMYGFVIAFILGFTGIGCFYHELKGKSEEELEEIFGKKEEV